MYVTPRQKKKTLTIALIIAIAIPIIVIAALIVTQLVSKASQEAKPKDIILSNLTSTSITVTWLTEVSAEGSVVYTANPTAGQVIVSGASSPVADARGAGRRLTHYAELSGLEPETEYYFNIISNGSTYSGSESKPFKFKTAKVADTAPVPNPSYGNIGGITSDDGVVFVIVENGASISMPVSSIIRTGGNWIVDISGLKNASNLSTMALNSDSDVTILAQFESGFGLVYTDAYSSIFDSNGRMQDSVDLEVSEGISIIAKIPTNATVEGQYAQNPDDPDATTTPPDATTTPPDATTTPPDATTTPPDATTTPPDATTTPPDATTTPNYVIASDVQWNGLVSASSTTNIKVPTGKATIQISNLSDKMFSIIWVSPTKEEGYVKFGTSTNALENEARDRRDSVFEKGTYFSHQVDVTRLDPATKYYYEIRSGSSVYRNGTVPYEITTFDTLASPPPYQSVAGRIENYDDPNDTVIVAKIQDQDGSGTAGTSTVISTTPGDNGGWILSVGDARSADGSAYYTGTDGDKIMATVVVPVPADPVEETYQDIAEKTIIIPTKEKAVEVKVSKIPPLSSYNIYTSLSALQSSLGGTYTDQNNEEDSDNNGMPSNIGGDLDSTPRTGVSPVVLVLGAFGLVSGSLLSLLFIRNKRPTKSSKMLDKFGF